MPSPVTHIIKSGVETLVLTPSATVVDFANLFRPAIERMFFKGDVELVVDDTGGLIFMGLFRGRENRFHGVYMSIDGQSKGELSSGQFYNFCITVVTECTDSLTFRTVKS